MGNWNVHWIDKRTNLGRDRLKKVRNNNLNHKKILDIVEIYNILRNKIKIVLTDPEENIKQKPNLSNDGVLKAFK
jgi:hypothetical protein